MAGEISCIPNLAELTAFAERARAENLASCISMSTTRT